MRIGGFEKQSFIDWEGKVSAVIFTKGCNFRCGFCHNPSLVLPELIGKTEDISEIEIFDYLKTRKKWLDGVVVTGGEPTLQSNLKTFLVSLKELGYPIKLDTNGSNPSVLKSLLESNLIDFVAMDIKTILNPEKYQQIIRRKIPDLIEKIESSICLLKESKVEYQLRTTLIPGFHSSNIINELQTEFLYCNYQLQEFRDGNTIANAQSGTTGS